MKTHYTSAELLAETARLLARPPISEEEAVVNKAAVPLIRKVIRDEELYHVPLLQRFSIAPGPTRTITTAPPVRQHRAQHRHQLLARRGR